MILLGCKFLKFMNTTFLQDESAHFCYAFQEKLGCELLIAHQYDVR